MSTWGPAITDNDTSSDVYTDFFDRYNAGEAPEAISREMIDEYAGVIQNEEDRNNFWLALGLAQWETKSLSPEVREIIRETILTGHDLLVWKELGATAAEIRRRQTVLTRFLARLATERARAKPRKQKRIYEPVFEKGTCLTFPLEDGKYGGAIVLAAEQASGAGYNLIVTTRIHLPRKPPLEDFTGAEVLVKTFGNWKEQPHIAWYAAGSPYERSVDLFEVIGQIDVHLDYTLNVYDGSVFCPLSFIPTVMQAQLAHEQTGGQRKLLPITKYIGKKRWWRW